MDTRHGAAGRERLSMKVRDLPCPPNTIKMKQTIAKPTVHDFVEDWMPTALVAGLYENKCRLCGATITGNKFRRTCAVCVEKAIVSIRQKRAEALRHSKCILGAIYEYVLKENEFHYDIWLRSGRSDTSSPYHQGAHCAMQDMGEWMRSQFDIK